MPKRIREFQTTVRAIEQLTKLDFGILRDHDTGGGEAEALEGKGRELLEFEDLRLAPAPARLVRVRPVARGTRPATSPQVDK
jgi:hypothetical protein